MRVRVRLCGAALRLLRFKRTPPTDAVPKPLVKVIREGFQASIDGACHDYEFTGTCAHVSINEVVSLALPTRERTLMAILPTPPF